MLLPIRSWLLTLLVLVAGPVARAHDPFSSWSNIHVRPDAIEVEVTMSRTAALSLFDNSANLPGIDPEKFEVYAARLRARGAALYSVFDGGHPLVLRSATVSLTEELDVAFLLAFPPPSVGPLKFRADYLPRMAEGHVATVYVTDRAENNLGWGELTVEHASLETPLPAGLSATPSAAVAGPPRSSPGFRTFVKLGVAHILTGYDHLLFLCGLLVVAKRRRTVITIITCFTVAHSITLAVAALGLVAVSARVVEPLIAGSIVFVGVENLLRHGEPKARWLLTFAFGLIHGFGFAGALIEIGLGANGTPMLVPLVSFNLGVELGQLGVAALFLPLLWQLRKWPPFARHGINVISTLVALAGAYWLIERTLFAP